MSNRVATLSTLQIIAKGIISESLSAIGQFYRAEINEKDPAVSYGRTDGLTLIVEKLLFKKGGSLGGCLYG